MEDDDAANRYLESLFERERKHMKQDIVRESLTERMGLEAVDSTTVSVCYVFL